MPSVTDPPPIPLDTKLLELRTKTGLSWKLGDHYPFWTEFSVR